ncbi:MAG TPA: lipopolysaccharide biosynthesis protein, partial [Thermoanaerobaculia bacterium]|nr:lipopolysaccharide biosynthesis protein [Thermoanaerobaculia bacterium]
MSIGREVSRAAAWIAVARYSGYAVQLAVVAVLARLLSPRDFGVMAAVLVFAGFINVFADAGLAPAIVDREELGARDLSTLFWFAAALSALLIAVTWLLAPAMERLFRIAGLSPALRLFSVSIFFVAAAGLPDGLLRRHLQFTRITAAQVSAAVTAGVTGIALALSGAQYRALIWMLVAHVASNFVFLCIAAGWRPRFEFDPAALHGTLHFGFLVTASALLTTAARTLDDLLIGRVHGPVQLGYYTQPYRVSLIAQDLVAGMVTPALQPVFARQNDPAAVRAVYGHVLRVIMWITFPVAALLAILATDVIYTLLGAGWGASVPVLRWLAAATALQAPAMTAGAALLARSRPRLLFAVGAANSTAFIVSFFLAVPYGIVAVAQAYVAANAVMMPLTLWITWSRVYEGTAAELLRLTLKPLLITVVVAAVA